MSRALNFELVKEGILKAIELNDFEQLHHFKSMLSELIAQVQFLIESNPLINKNNVDILEKAQKLYLLAVNISN
ncbi:MAG: hypothetical protein ACFFCE_06380 [Promethearchaeota archaeon]